MAKSEVRLILAISAVALIALGYFAYKERLRLAAARWHWKNGDSVRVGDYQVPVPRDWWVEPDSPFRAQAFFLFSTLAGKKTFQSFTQSSQISKSCHQKACRLESTSSLTGQGF